MLFGLLCAPKGGRLAAMSRFSMTGIRRSEVTVIVRRDSKLLIFDWFHVQCGSATSSRPSKAFVSWNPN